MPNPDIGDRRHWPTRFAPRRAGPSAALVVVMAILLSPLRSHADETQAVDRAAPASTNTAGSAPMNPRSPAWLDEVRAQRQASEERHQANRDAFGARRRPKEPWAAAQHEAWQARVQQRREARKQRIDQDRERWRTLGAAPPTPWDPPPPPPTTAANANPSVPTATDPAGATPAYSPDGVGSYPPAAAGGRVYAPQDWNNLWYFRGY
ncbi:MAG TPA: hypothetical protein VES73_13460 [Lamprocystis sp. (in: g-proteobacteria)]|nr:hypothetical protein [Lamprocystis sp. (in: g-proteobacteria)]